MSGRKRCFFEWWMNTAQRWRTEPDGGNTSLRGCGDPPVETLIYSIGHSTRSGPEFLELLTRYGIRAVADIRRYPGSRRHPQFSAASLESMFAGASVTYRHLPALGGRRSPQPDSPNTFWRNAQFRAYADHMSSAEFREGVEEMLALSRPLLFMCAEALPWRCHRMLLSDELSRVGLAVTHIISSTSTQLHEMNKSASDTGSHLVYRDVEAKQSVM